MPSRAKSSRGPVETGEMLPMPRTTRTRFVDGAQPDDDVDSTLRELAQGVRQHHVDLELRVASQQVRRQRKDTRPSERRRRSHSQEPGDVQAATLDLDVGSLEPIASPVRRN
jgi:hypothetical protein